MAGLVHYFSRWAEMTEVDGIFVSLVELICWELALFLKERMLKSTAEVTKYAEQYIEVHDGSITSRSTNKLSSNGAYNKQPQWPVHPSPTVQ